MIKSAINIEYKVPALDIEAPWGKNYTPAQVKMTMGDISSRYGELISNVSKLTNVPIEIIVSIITIESAGNANVTSSAGAIGLMQLMPATANDIVKNEERKDRLTNAELIALGNKKTFSTSDIYNPSINILLGAMFLGQIIDDEIIFRGILSTYPREVKLSRVVCRYTGGYYTKLPSKYMSEQGLYDTVSSTKKNYILKMVGVNGCMDLLTKQG